MFAPDVVLDLVFSAAISWIQATMSSVGASSPTSSAQQVEALLLRGEASAAGQTLGSGKAPTINTCSPADDTLAGADSEGRHGSQFISIDVLGAFDAP